MQSRDIFILNPFLPVIDDPVNIKYLIVGSGLTGLSTAYHLKKNYLIAEASHSTGGTAGTIEYKGFKLDNSIHILYFKYPEIKEWITNTLNIKLEKKERICSVRLEKSYVNFPVQYNLNELNLLSKLRFLSSLPGIKMKNNPANFEEYSVKSFGKYFTEIFTRPYNEKMFGVPLTELNVEWMGDYVPPYSTKKMLFSLSGLTSRYGRNSDFYYPSEGGISIIAKGIAENLSVPVICNSSLKCLYHDKKTALFTNGMQVNYLHLVSTIPLDSLLKNIKSLPPEISLCTGLLRKNKTTLLHITGKGGMNNIPYHWIYVPDPNIPFYRITFPGNICKANCPENYFALTLEFGGDVDCSLEFIENCISILKKMNILNEKIQNPVYFRVLLDCGYVIYDKKRKSTLDKIFTFLNNYNIISTGRYGNWEYSNMEEALMHGIRTAGYLLEKSS